MMNPPFCKYARSAAPSQSVIDHQSTSMMYATGVLAELRIVQRSVVVSSTCGPRCDLVHDLHEVLLASGFREPRRHPAYQ